MSKWIDFTSLLLKKSGVAEFFITCVFTVGYTLLFMDLARLFVENHFYLPELVPFILTEILVFSLSGLIAIFIMYNIRRRDKIIGYLLKKHDIYKRDKYLNKIFIDEAKYWKKIKILTKYLHNGSECEYLSRSDPAVVQLEVYQIIEEDFGFQSYREKSGRHMHRFNLAEGVRKKIHELINNLEEIKSNCNETAAGTSK